ncbi:UDP-N-acetylmuramate dehydrogenase [Helicobacter winghamensis]|uniref:UDP-N-acetylenolpyruvoylglucosamine reductase n=1 Tax=Helicobacter winghamensis TaxID=157268 RepID=A0A2N3PIN0_9HELI|nr:UDP-N-acetylmuramate dehydrogenase [Helicobacter winghamensis]EEO25644.1 UDP-N-acetylmuramate dehydrogenase [Helicobacter winghamensis ATCC BAA-430]PKT76089.1 UDP-N-acetylenolpyruvoylglucosamine reductase [Helicobacter winghamensis]PKT76724.1 UDP-N-acetylenolpyruvoylglucosamine reductase [Helicobacter winghamensis]PKT76845.1 UDP-N-acetylenolpyruvoylglucosamine reductase [Helicobacter winghamensis]PKT80600.1 UDP-N-acetylenolpyruvoylglucosamine reductase [Helicobacter winghamensis]
MFQKLIDFSQYTSVKIGSIQPLNFIESTEDYDRFLQSGETINIIGKANNLLISPNAKNLITLSKKFDYIRDLGDSLEIGAATPSGKIFSYAKRHNLSGFEILSKLPGSIGGIIKMNAGLKTYEIKDILDGILILDSNVKLKFKSVESLGLTYRNSAIKELIFAGIFKKKFGFKASLIETFAKMRANQPKEPSFGSCFKNPSGNFAGALIEQIGLKGIKFGKNKSLMFSQIHANFLVNLGNSSFNEALDLIHLAKEKVYMESKITLEEEVQIIQ